MTKAKLKIPKNYKPITSESSCLFTVSVGYEDLDGEELNSIFQTLNTTFKSCTISVCDTLQKYNLIAQQGLNLKEAEETSRSFGDHWIGKNKSIFHTLSIPYEIVRWDRWLLGPSYQEKMAYIESFYEKDEGFRNAILQTVSEYILRLERRESEEILNKEKLIEHSIRYLKEEAPVMLMQAEYGYNFEFYIKKRNEALRYLYESVIAKNYHAVMIPVYIKS